jgi:hypothetical protein
MATIYCGPSPKTLLQLVKTPRDPPTPWRAFGYFLEDNRRKDVESLCNPTGPGGCTDARAYQKEFKEDDEKTVLGSRSTGQRCAIIHCYLHCSLFGSPPVVNRTPLLLALCLGLVPPICAQAATVDPSSIPDGTYTVKVEKVIDSQHVEVSMDNGSDTTLSAGRSTVNFSKVQVNDQLKLSLIKGTVMVYEDLTSH